MDEELAEIVEAIRDGNIDEPRVEGIFKDSMGGKNPVYVTACGEFKIQLINSSNQDPLDDFDSILDSIADEIENGDEEGEVADNSTWNQIYWEVLPENAKGSLIK